MRLEGKVAMVTGGGSGIGRGIVHCMAQEGADLVIPDIQATNAAHVAEEVKGVGRRAVALGTDVTSQADIDRLLSHVLERFGRLDILVNNAGVASRPGMPFTNNTEEDWDRVFAVNVKSTFLLAKALTPHFMAETNPAFKGMTPRQVFDKRVSDLVPMRREQTPEDIGWAAVFLASDQAHNITGQALNVDGGTVMH
ncbi:MAG: SDR family oxidoreductase [Candidatus Rokubacteria bacterium]|nr:SDR family oxidoreductase [Candidatus Rokubacteria bacterium]